MIRRIIHIDEEKCDGCGLCVKACHEGAIELVNGKARLVRENFCDGLGDCLPNCPAGAITFEEREAPAYDEMAVKERQREKRERKVLAEEKQTSGCPGSRVTEFQREERQEQGEREEGKTPSVSRLAQWPCQIKLVPVTAPFFDGTDLLIAADCTAYAYARMHEDFMKGKVTVIGCPKLDAVDYSQKLTEIFAGNQFKSVTVVRMEVPCCGGLTRAVEKALLQSGKSIPCQIVIISRDGKLVK